MSDDFKTVRPEDVSDLALLPGEMRAFRVEMRDEIRAIASSLQALVRIEGRLDVLVDRQNETDRRLAAVEQRMTVLETKKTRRRK